MGFDHWLKHALDWVTDSFISLAIMDNSKNADCFIFVGAIGEYDFPELHFFAGRVSLNACTLGKANGKDQWKAGLY